MRELFFEDPFWVYVMLVAIEIFLLIFWWRSSDNSKAKWLLVPILAGGLVFAVEAMVETDREKLIKAVNSIAADVKNERLDVLESMISEDFKGEFQGRSLDKEESMELAREAMNTHGVTGLEIRNIDVKMKEDGRSASMVVVTRINLRYLGPRGSLLLRWSLLWKKIEGRWYIVYGETPRVGVM